MTKACAITYKSCQCAFLHSRNWASPHCFPTGHLLFFQATVHIQVHVTSSMLLLQDCDPFSIRCGNESCREQYIYDLSSTNKVGDVSVRQQFILQFNLREITI